MEFVYYDALNDEITLLSNATHSLMQFLLKRKASLPYMTYLGEL